jgi:hypothetical protein
MQRLYVILGFINVLALAVKLEVTLIPLDCVGGGGLLPMQRLYVILGFINVLALAVKLEVTLIFLNCVGRLGVNPAMFIVPCQRLRGMPSFWPCLHIRLVAYRLILVRSPAPVDFIAS